MTVLHVRSPRIQCESRFFGILRDSFGLFERTTKKWRIWLQSETVSKNAAYSSTVFNYSENSENAESLLMFCLKILDNHRYASLIIDNESFSEGHPILFVFMKSFPFPRKMQLLLRKKSLNHLQQRKKNSSPLCLGSSLSLCVCVSTMPVRHRRNGASDR